jgi:acetyl-CoA acetyltransferase
VCRRYMQEFALAESEIAAVVLAHQEWGRHHPQAEMYNGDTIAVEDVLSSPQIASPLRALMCAPWRQAGTAGAFLVTTRERAADLNCIPVSILGVGEASGGEYLVDRVSLLRKEVVRGPQPSLTTTAAKACAKDAYEMANVTPSDMKVVHTNSRFAHTSMLMLEDLGFCPKGAAADYVTGGHVSPGGSLPFNTNGGPIAFGQSGVSAAMDGVIEVVRQLRGEALGLQVECELGLVHAGGGVHACHAAAVLRRS